MNENKRSIQRIVKKENMGKNGGLFQRERECFRQTWMTATDMTALWNIALKPPAPGNGDRRKAAI
jgi:hypothetical protein